MYRCKECKEEYKTKVDYCDCGNNTFDYIEEAIPQKPKQPLTLEQKSEFVSRVFFAICLILSIIIWMIPVGKAPVKKQASKPKPAAVKNIPTIDKIWDDTPIYQPLKSELQPEVNRTEYPRQLASTSADYARQSYN